MAIRGELEILSLSGSLSVDANHLHLSRELGGGTIELRGRN